MPEIGSIRRRYDDCRGGILNADCLIWHGRPYRWLHYAIQSAGASRFVHAALAGWCYGRNEDVGGRLLLGEFGRGGGRLTLLSSQLQRHSGEWSVFRPAFHDDQQRRLAFDFMVQMTGQRYSNLAIWCNYLRALPVLRWFFGRRSDENDATTWGARTCSSSVARCLRLVGLNPLSGDSWSDPVPHKADYLCSPTDLVRSAFLSYQFTIEFP
jgi:hypothetical protein